MTTNPTSSAYVPRRKERPVNWVLRARTVHLYLGVLFAPALVFFALSGAFQLFGFQDADEASSYRPPSWMRVLASVHKDQMLPAKPRQVAPAIGIPRKAPTHGGEDVRSPVRIGTVLLKCYFLTLAIGLMTTTLLGLYLALRSIRRLGLAVVLFAAGCLIPVTLLLI